MLVVNWLLDRKVEYVGHMDSTITGSMSQWMLVVNWLLARKEEFDDDMDSRIAGSMNARS
jgi:hypothetical protein